MNANVSGTLQINCDKNACKKVIEESGKVNGVMFSFLVDKKSKSDPDLIVNVSGMTKHKIEELVTNIIRPIVGVKEIKVEIGNSLLY